MRISDWSSDVCSSDLGAVEALFNPRRDATHDTTTDPGIAFALDAIRDTAVATDCLLDRIETSLDKKSESLADQLEKIEAREDAYKARLEKQFGRSEAHTSEPQSLMRSANAAFRLEKQHGDHVAKKKTGQQRVIRK